jgi:hypothetical protein
VIRHQFSPSFFQLDRPLREFGEIYRLAYPELPAKRRRSLVQITLLVEKEVVKIAMIFYHRSTTGFHHLVSGTEGHSD